MVADALGLERWEDEHDRYDLNAMYACSLQIRTGVLIDDYKYKRIGDQESVDCQKACYDARKVSNCVSCQSPKLGFRGNVVTVPIEQYSVGER
jgi:hypothetical protein